MEEEIQTNQQDTECQRLRADIALLDLAEDDVILRAQTALGVHHQHRNIGAPENLQSLFHTLHSKLALVVQTGGVDYHDRACRQQLHGLVNGVGGSAFHVGDDGHFLAGDGIEKAGFACIAAAKECDVGSFGYGSFVPAQGGVSFTFFRLPPLGEAVCRRQTDEGVLIISPHPPLWGTFPKGEG